MSENTFIPELLAPAGDFSKMQTALMYGADAVYLGGDTLNLRAATNGLSKNELIRAVELANQQKARIYYCLNSYPMPRDFLQMPAIIEEAAASGVHGFIVADPGVLSLVKRHAPGVEIHLSTQANTTNSQAIDFWREAGVSRVNLARELSYEKIEEIRKKSPHMDLEVFVHGAMCLAVSGQCLLSSWLNDRPANLGQCTQPCRFEYKSYQHVFDEMVVDESMRTGREIWRVKEGEAYSSFWAPSDLCLLPYLPWFAENRINAIKIEGRVKTSAYLAHVVDAYKSALTNLGENWQPDAYVQEALRVAVRNLSTGFFFPNERIDISARYGHNGRAESAVLAQVADEVKDGVWLVDIRGRWQNDYPVELMLPGMQRPKMPDYGLENHKGQACLVAHSGTRCLFYCQHPDIKPGIFIRKSVD